MRANLPLVWPSKRPLKILLTTLQARQPVAVTAWSQFYIYPRLGTRSLKIVSMSHYLHFSVLPDGIQRTGHKNTIKPKLTELGKSETFLESFAPHSVELEQKHSSLSSR